MLTLKCVYAENAAAHISEQYEHHLSLMKQFRNAKMKALYFQKPILTSHSAGKDIEY